MNTKFLMIFAFTFLFSSIFVGAAYGSIFLDKEVYTWTDKINIRITEHGVDNASVRIYTSDHELNNYKLAKAGNGLYTGEVVLTGFLHDVDGDGKPDTNPHTTGNGPNNGFLEAKLNRGFTVSVEFGDGDVISKSAMIRWNEGTVNFNTNYSSNQSVKLQINDIDMNLNPKILDTLQVHVSSDSDKAGILVDAIETQEASGLFETMISFTQDKPSGGNRLFAILGDMIYAQYDDYTLPTPYGINDNLEIVAEVMFGMDSQKTISDDDQMGQQGMMGENMMGNYHMPYKGMCAPGFASLGEICTLDDRCGPGAYPGKICMIDGIMKQYLRPLQQKHAGISAENIICAEGKHLMFKHHDATPACFNFDSVEKLKYRGWQTEKPPIACTLEYNPVCGVDGITYGNMCALNAEHMAMSHHGECIIN